jgi:hypothetical protein
MLLAVLLGPLLVAQTVDPLSADDLDALADRLRARVAEIHVDVQVPDDLPLLNDEEIVYGVAIDERHVLCVAQLLDRARAIWVHGPTGRTRAKLVLDDRERRIAILETGRPVSAVGLEPSAPLPRDAREQDQPVFALIATTGDGTALSGVITDPGYQIQNEGHPTTTLKLTRGMPVFDVELRWVGLSRTLAWDPNDALLIPPELVEAARDAAAPKPEPKAPERPWWAKDL